MKHDTRIVMKHAKWLTHRSTFGLVGVVLLAGLLPTSPYAQVTVADTQAANTQSYSLWSTFGKVAESDIQPVELGMKFRADVDGSVSAVRFFRAVPVDSGYTVHIWSATGELLGMGIAIEGQSPTPGWQTIQVYPPVAVKAGVTYVASYYASKGQYSVSEGFFSNTTVTNGPLLALGDGVDGGNGVFAYGEGGGFPMQSYNANNYWVDVLFTPTNLP
jgi:hypothetical protein